MKIPEYPFTIHELTPDDGGGFLIEFPDLPGCMSDGSTVEEAIVNGFDAVQCWILVAKEKGREVPTPGEIENQSGKWVQRVPRSLHARLTKQAKREHVSLTPVMGFSWATRDQFNNGQLQRLNGISCQSSNQVSHCIEY